MSQRNLWKFVVPIVLIVSLLFVGMALAQESTAEFPTPTAEATVEPTAEPTLPPVPEPGENPPGTEPVFEAPAPESVLTALVTALVAALSTAIASPLTATVVSLLKRFPAFDRFSGEQLNLGVASILTLVMWGAVALGYGTQADTAYQLLYAILPILFGIGGNFAGNKAVYSAASRNDVPVVGYSRSISRSVR